MGRSPEQFDAVKSGQMLTAATWLSPDATLTLAESINWSTKEFPILQSGFFLEPCASRSDWEVDIGDAELLETAMGAIYWINESRGMTINLADSRDSLQLLFSGRAKRGIGLQLLRRPTQWANKEEVDLDVLRGRSPRNVIAGNFARLSFEELTEQSRKSGIHRTDPAAMWYEFCAWGNIWRVCIPMGRMGVSNFNPKTSRWGVGGRWESR